MDGVEIAESLLYKDFEKLSTNKTISDIANYYSLIERNRQSLLDCNEIKSFQTFTNQKLLNASELSENEFLVENKVIQNEILNLLINQLTNPISTVKIVDDKPSKTECSFRPIITTETQNLKKENKSFPNVPCTKIENTKEYSNSNRSSFSEELDESLSVLIELNKNINSNVSKKDALDFSSNGSLIISNSNTITNNTLSYSDLSSFNLSSFDGRMDRLKIDILDSYKEKDNACQKLKENCSNNSSSLNKSDCTYQSTQSLNGPLINSHKNEASAITIPKGSYIFIPLTPQNRELISKSTNAEIKTIQPVSDSQPITNSNKYLITCYPVMTQMQDLRLNSTKLTPIVLQKTMYGQECTRVYNQMEQNKARYFRFQNKKEVDVAKNKKIETNELHTCLEDIIESHQLLVKEKNEISADRNNLKDDKFKGFINLKGKFCNNLSKVERELTSLINTLFEINVLISKLEAARNIHFIEPFYQILQNCAELIQNFQWNCKDDPTKNQSTKMEKDVQNQITKLKQMYVCLQEIRSFLWATSHNVDVNQDSKAKLSLKTLKYWVESKWSVYKDQKSKENAFKLLTSNNNYITENYGNTFRNSIKLEQNNLQSHNFSFPGTHFQNVIPAPTNQRISAFAPPTIQMQAHFGPIRASMCSTSSTPTFSSSTPSFTGMGQPSLPSAKIHQLQQNIVVSPKMATVSSIHHQAAPPPGIAFRISNTPSTLLSNSQIRQQQHQPQQPNIFTTPTLIPNLQAAVAAPPVAGGRNFVITPTTMVPSIIYHNNRLPLFNSSSINYMFYKANTQIA